MANFLENLLGGITGTDTAPQPNPAYTAFDPTTGQPMPIGPNNMPYQTPGLWARLLGNNARVLNTQDYQNQVNQNTGTTAQVMGATGLNNAFSNLATQRLIEQGLRPDLAQSTALNLGPQNILSQGLNQALNQGNAGILGATQSAAQLPWVNSLVNSGATNTLASNAADTSGNVNRNILNQAQNPFQRLLGQIVARAQMAQGQQQIAQSNMGGLEARQRQLAMEQNPNISSQMYQMQPQAEQAEINARNRTPMFAGGTTAIYGQDNTPSGFVSEQYPRIMMPNGQPMAFNKINPQPTYMPSGVQVFPPGSSEGWVNKGGQQNPTTPTNANAGSPVIPPRTTALPIQGGANPSMPLQQQQQVSPQQPAMNGADIMRAIHALLNNKAIEAKQYMLGQTPEQQAYLAQVLAAKH